MSFDADEVRTRREDTLLRLLVRATHVMNAEMTTRVRQRGHAGFQPHFTSVLAWIDTEGTTISALALRLGTSRQAASQVVQTIEAAGIVERVPNPEDGRSVIVRHTAAGRQLLVDAIDDMTEIEEDYARVLGAADIAELKGRLTRLLGHTDPAGTLRSP